MTYDPKAYEVHLQYCQALHVPPHPLPYSPERWDELLLQYHRLPELRRERATWWQRSAEHYESVYKRRDLFIWLPMGTVLFGLPIRHVPFVLWTSLISAVLGIVFWFVIGVKSRRRLRSLYQERDEELELLDFLIDNPEKHAEVAESFTASLQRP